MKQIVFLLTLPLLALILLPAASWSPVEAWEEYRPKLAEGEMYYSGTGKFDDCESVELGFILSADKSEVREFTIALENLAVVAQDGNSQTRHNIRLVKTTYYSAAPAIGGKADVKLGAERGSLLLSGLGEKKASAELSYIISLETGADGVGMSKKVTVPLGTTQITLKGGYEVP